MEGFWSRNFGESWPSRFLRFAETINEMPMPTKDCTGIGEVFSLKRDSWFAAGTGLTKKQDIPFRGYPASSGRNGEEHAQQGVCLHRR